MNVLHGTPDVVETRAGVVADLFLGKDAALDLRIYRSQGFQYGKKLFQRILRKFGILMPSI